MRIDLPKFDKYYKRVIRKGELKYIKQEHLEGETMNITDSKMFAEVDDYNRHAMQMRAKKQKFNIDFWGTFTANCIFFILELVLVMMLDTGIGEFTYSIIYALTNSVAFCLFAAFAAFAALVFFVYMKKNFSRVLMTGLTLVLCCVSIFFIVPAVADIVFVRILRELYDDMKDDVGFPHFVNIVTTYIRDDDGMEDGVMSDAEEKYTFEKYKRKIDDDEIIL